MRAKWLIPFGSAVVAGGSAILFYVYPSETAQFISKTFGVSNYDAAVDIIYGTLITSAIIFGTFAVLNIAGYIQRRRMAAIKAVSVQDQGHAEAQRETVIPVEGKAKAGPPTLTRRFSPESIEFWGNIAMALFVGAFFVWFGYDLYPLAVSHPSVGTYGIVVIPEAAAVYVFKLTSVRVRTHRMEGAASTHRMTTGVETARTPELLPERFVAEKQALDNWKKDMHDALSSLKGLDPRKYPQTTTDYLDRLQPLLNRLPYTTVVQWDEETRTIISEFVDYIVSLFWPNWTGYEERCLEWINILEMRNDPHVHDLLKTKFLRIIAKLKDDFRFEKNPTALGLFQSLSDYATNAMMDLVKAALDEGRAAIGDGWSDDRFNAMFGAIAFHQMKTANTEGLRAIASYLFDLMKANDLTNPVTYKKAKMLHDRAEAALRS